MRAKIPKYRQNIKITMSFKISNDGSIDADFCGKRAILQHFSRPTRKCNLSYLHISDFAKKIFCTNVTKFQNIKIFGHNLIFWPYFRPYYFKYLLIPCFTLKFNMSAKIESQEVAGARASCEARVPAAHRSHLAAAGPLPRDEGARQRRREQGPADERLVHHL